MKKEVLVCLSKMSMTIILLVLLNSCGSKQVEQLSVSNGLIGSYESITLPGAKGSLFIIGGGSRSLSLMSGMVDRLSTLDDLVIVLPMASSEPDTSMFYGKKPLVSLGCTNVHGMNLQPGKFGTAQLDSIRSAGGIYLCGGDQSRFMDIAQGEMQEAIQQAFRQGAVIAGSSAGAAMMSNVMITGDQLLEPEYESTYKRLYENNAIYLEGLGLIQGAIIDQHFVERSRYNRAFTALYDHPHMPVFGIGESTALVVEPQGLSVEGEGHVVVFYPSKGRTDSTGQLNFRNLRVDILVHGESLD